MFDSDNSVSVLTSNNLESELQTAATLYNYCQHIKFKANEMKYGCQFYRCENVCISDAL
jgi:hypothetical protein